MGIVPCLELVGTFHFSQGHFNRQDTHCGVDCAEPWTLCTLPDISKTMLYLKKYFTEGLIQMAILLSLCGMRVDVGLEPYLPPSWHNMILGPTSALTQTQFHNLRNHLEDGHSLHPKNVDLDGFFTARRLLGWVHSLDRLQVGNHVHLLICLYGLREWSYNFTILDTALLWASDLESITGCF